MKSNIDCRAFDTDSFMFTGNNIWVENPIVIVQRCLHLKMHNQCLLGIHSQSEKNWRSQPPKIGGKVSKWLQ